MHTHLSVCLLTMSACSHTLCMLCDEHAYMGSTNRCGQQKEYLWCCTVPMAYEIIPVFDGFALIMNLSDACLEVKIWC